MGRSLLVQRWIFVSHSNSCPGGESVEQMEKRVDSVIAKVRRWHQEYLEDSTSDKPDVMIFAHGHFGRVLITRWLGFPLADGRLFAIETNQLTQLDREVFQSWNCIGMCVAVAYHVCRLKKSKVSVLGYGHNGAERAVLDVLNVRF